MSSMRQKAQATAVFPWKELLLRSGTFVGSSTAGLMGLIVGILTVSYLKEGSSSSAPLLRRSVIFEPFLVVYALAPFVMIIAGVFGANLVANRFRFGKFSGEVAALAASQKILLICISLQMLTVFVFQGSFILLVYWILGAVGTWLVVLAMGYDKTHQIKWVILTGLVGIVPWVVGMFSTAKPISPVLAFFVGAVGILGSLVFILILNSRATRQLKSAGLKVGFFGVSVREIPALPATPVIEVAAQSVVTPQAQPEPKLPETNKEAGFFYVGPGNEPIGPVSTDVLLQLRQSGVVNDQTMVAPEGETEWKPLRAYIEVVEESES